MKIRLNLKSLSNRTVKLHWFGNVRQNAQHNWRIRLAFLDGNDLFSIDSPIGLLPTLSIGRWYQMAFL